MKKLPWLSIVSGSACAAVARPNASAMATFRRIMGDPCSHAAAAQDFQRNRPAQSPGQTARGEPPEAAAPAAPARAAASFPLRLGRAGRAEPGGLRAAGAGGGRAVGVRRADDRGVRLVPRLDLRRGVAGRAAGGVRVADAD